MYLKFILHRIVHVGQFSRKLSIATRFKSGRLKKWADYWKNVAIDYKEAIFDIIKDSKANPLKTSLCLTGLAGIVYAIGDNPSEEDFRDSLRQFMNESAMHGDKTRNKNIDNVYNHLIECFNHDLVRRISLGFCSILWIDNYSTMTGIYKSRCSYLKPRYLTFHERVVDVGFLGTWWNIRRKYRAYDINEEEWNQPKAGHSDVGHR